MKKKINKKTIKETKNNTIIIINIKYNNNKILIIKKYI